MSEPPAELIPYSTEGRPYRRPSARHRRQCLADPGRDPRAVRDQQTDRQPADSERGRAGGRGNAVKYLTIQAENTGEARFSLGSSNSHKGSCADWIHGIKQYKRQIRPPCRSLRFPSPGEHEC